MMQLRKMEKETVKIAIRKLTNICRIVRREINSTRVITGCFVRIPGELGHINVENYDKDLK
jgi:hypothetical protein